MTKDNIPQPFRNDEFSLFKKGIFDDPKIDVYINRQNDFAYLSPTPKLDYTHYIPRVKKIGLAEYKKRTRPIERRLEKIFHLLQNFSGTLLEIGAGDGEFLYLVKESFPNIELFSMDQDQNTAAERKKYVTQDFANMPELLKVDKKFDVICFFHVLEHIIDPASFLADISKLMHNSSLLIIEIPSLFDPLLSLYKSKAFSEFYFQYQHPYVYSHDSLRRLMKYNNFKTKETINYQRYGLDSHLNWFANQEPGGNEVFWQIFKELDNDYIKVLEQYGKTDTVFWVGKKR